MKLNILGTKYDYIETTESEDSKLCNKDGYCDSYAKKIVVENGHNEIDPDNIGDFDSFRKKIKRHEIIHAFLYESGIPVHSEERVDWLAWQFPKLLKAFRKVNAI